jgi:hypothetical protein
MKAAYDWRPSVQFHAAPHLSWATPYNRTLYLTCHSPASCPAMPTRSPIVFFPHFSTKRSCDRSRSAAPARLFLAFC